MSRKFFTSAQLAAKLRESQSQSQSHNGVSRYYVTFGEHHRHPVTGESLRGRFVMVHAASSIDARALLHSRLSEGDYEKFHLTFAGVIEEERGLRYMDLEEFPLRGV